jgi:hypothetical protein
MSDRESYDLMKEILPKAATDPEWAKAYAQLFQARALWRISLALHNEVDPDLGDVIERAASEIAKAITTFASSR